MFALGLYTSLTPMNMARKLHSDPDDGVRVSQELCASSYWI